MNLKYLIIGFFLILGNLYAINVTLNETIDVSRINSIDRIDAHNDEIFIAFDVQSSIWRYKIDYEENELERIRSFGEFNRIRDMWIDDEIAYVLDNNYVYKINYDTRKELFKGDSDSYFPRDPYAIAVKNNGEYIFLIDRNSDRINILYEYDRNKYLSKGSISMSTHGVAAYFEDIRDIEIYEDKMYVLDRSLEQITVFKSDEPYEYLNVLAGGRAGYNSVRPTKIEIDELFIYILEDFDQKITFMDKETGEKIFEIKNDCENEIYDFAYDNDRIYVLCENKEDLLVYDIDKRITRTKEQVENLLERINNRVRISCELYEASLYFKVNVQNKCDEFLNKTTNYTYTNYNDAFEELTLIEASVIGYNSGVTPQLNNKIKLNVTYYMDEMMGGTPYTGAKNHTATRIIWDLEEILDYKQKSEYLNAVEKSKIAIRRFNDFMNDVVYEDEEEEEREEREEIEENDYELIKIINEFEYYKPLLQNYSLFEMEIFKIEELILEVENNETEVSELQEEFNKIKEKYYEYREDYNNANEKIIEIEEMYEEIKNNLLVNTQEIELELTSAREKMETNPKEALVHLQNAEQLIEDEKSKSDNYIFLGLFGIGFLVVGIIFLILIGIGLFKYLKKKK